MTALTDYLPTCLPTGHYVEYLSDSPSKEYAFLQKKCLEPLTPFSPPAAQAKKPASFKRSMRAAEQERETADRVIKVRESSPMDDFILSCRVDR